jgi:D-3-phosphoglycerate dehydrogenase
MTGPKMTARVLVADKLEEGAFRDLVARGFEIIERTDLTSENLPAALPGVKVLVVRSTIVTKEAIAAADRLALIVRAGSGTNNIDVAAASARGIYVSNCPGRNSVAVAELTLGLLLAIDRRLPDNVADLRRGKWDKGSYSKAKGLKGRRLGLVGFGAIAQEVARRAQAFELEVQAYARTLSDDVAKRFGVDRSTSLDELFESSDIVSLHVPLSKETRGMIGAALLGRLKRGAVFLNTARAEVVDQVALLEVAKAGKIWVGTDVFAAEPEGKSGDFSDELGRLSNVYGSHHIGASTDQAQHEIAKAAVGHVRAFLERGEVKDSVNILHAPPVQGTLVVRHLDRVGVLAAVLGALRNDDVNVETMENVIFAGGLAACARIKVAQRPQAATIEHLAGLEHVISVELL